MKDDRTWVPDGVDLDWIESIAQPIPPAAAAIEAAAEPLGVPIVDRHSGRVLAALAAGRRRIVEVGTAYGNSTLWLALGQPADGTIVTIDPDTERTDIARGFWRQGGIADERIVQVTAPALDAFAAGDPRLAGPFDLAFIDALKPEYGAYLDALVDGGRLADGALVVADNVLWSGKVLDEKADKDTKAIKEFNRKIQEDPRVENVLLPVRDGILIMRKVRS